MARFQWKGIHVTLNTLVFKLKVSANATILGPSSIRMAEHRQPWMIVVFGDFLLTLALPVTYLCQAST